MVSFHTMISSQLLDYVRQQLGAGVSKEEIVKSLITNGWQVSDINEAFASIANPSFVPQPTQPVQPAAASILNGHGTLIPVGQLFSSSWDLYKQRLPILLALLFILSAPLFIVQLLSVTGNVVLGSVFLLICFLLLMPILGASVSVISKGTGFLDSFQQGIRLFFPLLWVLILFEFVVIGGIVLFVIPGIIMMIGFFLSIFISVIEGKRGLNALLQSREYVRGYWWAIFGRLLLAYAVIFIPVYAFQLLVSRTFGETSGMIAYLLLSLFFVPFLMVYSYKIYQNLTVLKPSLATTTPTSGRGFLIASGILGVLAIPIIILLSLWLVVFISRGENIYGFPNPGSTVTSTGVESQQMIVSKATTVQSGETTVFIVNKYPKDAVSWSLRLDCSTGVSAMMQSFALDGKTLVGKDVNCNEDVALNKEPYSKYPQLIIFGMKATVQTSGDKTVTIVSKTFDSSNVLLNQSSIPITVQVSSGAIIQSVLSKSRTLAEIYYSNGDNYSGVCTKADGVLNEKNELAKISSSVVCKDSLTAWAMSAQLESDTLKYWCADSTGTSAVQDSAITTTSCK